MPKSESTTARSRSYVVPVSSALRDQVLDLAERRGASAADLVRAVMLLVDEGDLDAYQDPGGPIAADRETVVVQSGAAKDRVLRRKPRVQVRLKAGLAVEHIRKALALAIDMDRGEKELRLSAPGEKGVAERLDAVQDEAERLCLIISAISFEPLRDGIHTRSDALYVLGFPPHQKPDPVLVREKFRLLAKIHHPDAEFGDHLRMAQLNQAMRVLKSGGL